jgi:hypothetical protein
MSEKQKKVVFATPTITRPFPQYLDALEASIPLIVAAGWDEAAVYEVGCPYISHARARMTRRALDAKADVIVYLDHDCSWAPRDLLTLLETEGDVVAGTYRFKKAEEAYMGTICTDADDRPVTRADGCIRAEWVPAGFLKVTRDGIRRFMKAYPELLFGPPDNYSVDLFNFGAHKGVLYGEDYAFSRNWNDLGGEIWIVPTLHIDHHSPEKAFKGCFHDFLLRQPGGSEAATPPA